MWCKVWVVFLVQVVLSILGPSYFCEYKNLAHILLIYECFMFFDAIVNDAGILFQFLIVQC